MDAEKIGPLEDTCDTFHVPVVTLFSQPDSTARTPRRHRPPPDARP